MRRPPPSPRLLHLLLPWLSLAGACGDPQLRVTFIIPDLYLGDQACLDGCTRDRQSCEGDGRQRCEQQLRDCLAGCESVVPQCLNDCTRDAELCQGGGIFVCENAYQICTGACGGVQECVDACRDPWMQCQGRNNEDCQVRISACRTLCGRDEPCLQQCDTLNSICGEAGSCDERLAGCQEQCNACEEFCTDQYGGESCSCVPSADRPCPQPEGTEICADLEQVCARDCGGADVTVVSTSLQLYVSRGDPGFGCEDLAFGEVSDEVLQASLVQEIVGGAEQTLMSGVDRMARKVFLAQGFDASGVPVVVGCQEVGAIVRDTEVVLRGEPSAVLRSAAALQEPLVIAPGGAGAPDITLEVEDAQGRALAGVGYRWLLLGPADDPAETAPRAGVVPADGVLQLQLAWPRSAGPVLLRVQVRWQRGDPFTLRATVAPAPVTFRSAALSGGGPVVFGRLGSQAEPAVALLQAETQSRTMAVHLVSWGPGGGWRESSTGLELLGPCAMGLIEGEPRDDLLVVCEDGGATYSAGVVQRHDLQQLGVGRVAGATVLPVSSCGPQASREVAVFGGTERIVVLRYDEGVLNRSELVPFVELGEPVLSTCLADQNDTPRRLLAGSAQRDGEWWLSGLLEQSWGSVATPGGWSLVGAGTSGDLLLSVAEGDSSPQLQTWALVHQPSVKRLVLSLRREVSLFSAPVAVAAGRLDGDDRDDLAALVVRSAGAGLASYYLQLFRGVAFEGALISSLMPAGESPTAPSLWLVDLDGDGHDDLVTLRWEMGLSLDAYLMGPG